MTCETSIILLTSHGVLLEISTPSYMPMRKTAELRLIFDQASNLPNAYLIATWWTLVTRALCSHGGMEAFVSAWTGL